MHDIALRFGFVRSLGGTRRVRGKTAARLVPIRPQPVSLPEGTFVPISFALDEGTFDVMLGYKLANNFGDAGEHRHRFDQIVSGVTKSLAFRGVRRNCEKLIGWTGYRRTQGDPQVRRGGRQIVAVGACRGPMQLKYRRASVQASRHPRH